MSERVERCETCRFWVNNPISASGAPDVVFLGYPGADADGYVRAGECHRRAPQTVSGSIQLSNGEPAESWPDNAQGIWPLTMPLDWCGDFQPATPTKAEEGEQAK
jgi:hypothetical protein